ncbi:MAG: hypothetical protein N2483_08560 [Burkholderiaceae bacterium]|nr:hypothetical protein [Burkholderiaceae bacterium]
MKLNASPLRAIAIVVFAAIAVVEVILFAALFWTRDSARDAVEVILAIGGISTVFVAAFGAVLIVVLRAVVDKRFADAAVIAVITYPSLYVTWSSVQGRLARGLIATSADAVSVPAKHVMASAFTPTMLVAACLALVIIAAVTGFSSYFIVKHVRASQ